MVRKGQEAKLVSFWGKPASCTPWGGFHLLFVGIVADVDNGDFKVYYFWVSAGNTYTLRVVNLQRGTGMPGVCQVISSSLLSNLLLNSS